MGFSIVNGDVVGGGGAGGAAAPSLKFPTDRMRTAHNLCTQHGLDDAEIGKRLNCSREWACKLRAEFRRRLYALQVVCASRGDCNLVQMLAG